MIVRLFLGLFFVLYAISMHSQTAMQEQILGKWKFIKKNETVLEQKTKSLDSVANIKSSDVFFKKDIILHFRDKKSLAFEIENESFSLIVSYGLKDSLLTITIYKYQLLKLNKETLLFEVKNDSLHKMYEYKRL